MATLATHLRRATEIFAVVLGINFLVGCTPAPTDDATHTLTLADHTFTVEIADTPAERERGLMGRTELGDDRGMLFVFDEPQRVSFWMKNTLIPLDILYFDSERKLVQLYVSTPPCEADPCPTYPSTQHDIRYVLELPAGTVDAIGPLPLGQQMTWG